MAYLKTLKLVFKSDFFCPYLHHVHSSTGLLEEEVWEFQEHLGHILEGVSHGRNVAGHDPTSGHLLYGEAMSPKVLLGEDLLGSVCREQSTPCEGAELLDGVGLLPDDVLH